MKTRRGTMYDEIFLLLQTLAVCSRRETTSCQNLVKAILYPPRLTNAAVEWGKEKEMMAREQLQVELGIEINDCGIFIDENISYLAATPDGIIGDDTIVEIKCPYAARQVSPTDAMLNKIANINRIFDKTDDTRMNQTRVLLPSTGAAPHNAKKLLYFCCVDTFWIKVHVCRA